MAALEAALSDKTTVELVRKFITEGSSSALLVERLSVREEEEGEGEEKETVTYTVTAGVHYSSGKKSSVVCLKRTPVIEGEKSISSQLRVLSLRYPTVSISDVRA